MISVYLEEMSVGAGENQASILFYSILFVTLFYISCQYIVLY